jgi:hypothetical protein
LEAGVLDRSPQFTQRVVHSDEELAPEIWTGR